MDEGQFYTLLFFGGIAVAIFFFGYSMCPCDKNPQNVEYWKTKYYEEQKKNEFLTDQILDVLVNSYTKKLVWSVSGLGSYKMVCYTDYSNLEIPQGLKEILNTLCKSKTK